MYHFASIYSKPGDYVAARAMDTGRFIIDYEKISNWAEYKSDLAVMESIQLTNLEINFSKKHKKIRPRELTVHSLIWIIRKGILSRLTYVMGDNVFKKILHNSSSDLNNDGIDLHAPILRILDENSTKCKHYSNLHRLIITYIPKDSQFLSNGTNENMITVYFPSSNELIFAFKGTDIGVDDGISNINHKLNYDTVKTNIKVDCSDNTISSDATQKCKKIADNISHIYMIKKYTTKPISIQTTGHSLGGIIALKTALKIGGCCIGFNAGGRGYCLNPSKSFMKQNFIHVHNPKDTFSNNFIQDDYTLNRNNSYISKFILNCCNFISHSKSVSSSISKTTILLDHTKIVRQNLVNSKNTDFLYHNLDNAIIEIEELIIGKIFTERYLTENMLIKQNNKFSNNTEMNDYSRICIV